MKYPELNSIWEIPVLLGKRTFKVVDVFPGGGVEYLIQLGVESKPFTLSIESFWINVDKYRAKQIEL